MHAAARGSRPPPQLRPCPQQVAQQHSLPLPLAPRPAFVAATASASASPAAPVRHAVAAVAAALSSLLHDGGAHPLPTPQAAAPVAHTATAPARTTARRARTRTGHGHAHAHAHAHAAIAVHPFRALTRLVTPAPPTPAQLQQERENRRIAEEAWGIFRARYVDASRLDWARLRFRLDRRRLRSADDLQTSLNWLLGRAQDPFTRYLPEWQLSAMRADIDGEMCGVGLVFSAARRAGPLANVPGLGASTAVVIRQVVPRSPAARAGLQPGDRITAIDMVPVHRLTFDGATARLLGPPGKKVLLSFRRDADAPELSVLLTRRRFAVPTVSARRVAVRGLGPVAYVQVREFAARTAAQARVAVRDTCGDGVRAIVLDMRGNAGGLVDRAVELAKVFLQRGRVVVRFVGRDGIVTTERAGWRDAWPPPLLRGARARARAARLVGVPMVVLVDGETASASELVAAALRDNCRAVVVGSRTFGKGSVQAIVPLSRGGGLAVTVARYRTPRDDGIVMGKGLKPDLYRTDLAEDGDEAVAEVFGRGSRRRLRWIASRLDRCSPPGMSTHSALPRERTAGMKLVAGIVQWANVTVRRWRGSVRVLM